MHEDPPILDYVARAPPRHEAIIIEKWATGVRVVFPAAPAWRYAIQILLYTLFPLMVLPIVATQPLTDPTLNPANLWLPHQTLVSRGKLILVWAGMGGWAIQSVMLALSQWYTIIRFGRVPLVVEASQHSLVVRALAMWRPREQFWPTDRITRVKLIDPWKKRVLGWGRCTLGIHSQNLILFQREVEGTDDQLRTAIEAIRNALGM